MNTNRKEKKSRKSAMMQNSAETPKSTVSQKSALLKIIAIASIMILVIASFSACAGKSSEPEESSLPTAMSDFATVDLNGNEVTQDVLAEAEITMFNFWGTYCGPCISEMPDIQKLSEEYAGRVQVIGVPVDVDFDKPDSAEFKEAEKILENAGATFTNIKPAGGIIELMETMQFIPTTMFVDSEGNVLGEPIVGAMLEEYRNRIEENLAKDPAA